MLYETKLHCKDITCMTYYQNIFITNLLKHSDFLNQIIAILKQYRNFTFGNTLQQRLYYTDEKRKGVVQMTCLFHLKKDVLTRNERSGVTLGLLYGEFYLHSCIAFEHGPNGTICLLSHPDYLTHIIISYIWRPENDVK